MHSINGRFCSFEPGMLISHSVEVSCVDTSSTLRRLRWAVAVASAPTSAAADALRT